MRTKPFLPHLLLLAVVASLLPTTVAAAQSAHVATSLDDHPLAHRMRMARVDRSRGFAALWVGVLDAWGWTVNQATDWARAESLDGTVIVIRAGTPFVRADTSMLQLADAPYRKGENLFVPIQLVFELGGWPVEGDPRPVRLMTPPRPAPRLVFIDAGHGGEDAGVVGIDGTREKDVTLALALALARVLAEDPAYDVRLTRDRDVFVPLSDRGAVATAVMGTGPAVLLSLHATLDPESPSTRGFESFVLGPAATGPDRRLAERENADASGDAAALDAASFVRDDIRRESQEPWSTRLAQSVQRQLGTVHPGAPKGVAHAPLTVLEDALMPAAFVELGFLSNRREAALLSDPAFQGRAAIALARALDDFFLSYPRANSWTGSSAPR